MGVLKTERLDAVMAAEPEKYAAFFQMAESPQFTGLVIDALYRDQNLLEKSGQAFIGAELGQELGVKDIDGSQPHSHREQLGGPIPYNPAVVS